jgi:glycosyltransferase involved in cell wall biosynthesis
MPIIAQRSDIGLRVAGSGSDRAEWLSSIAGQRIRIEGPVENLAEQFNRVRVFVAPTRFGAGIAHKVVDAARHGVPVVATGLIASQLRWRDGVELLVRDTPEEMAEACIALYHDEPLWERLRSGALAAVRRDFDPAAFDAAVAREAWNGALEDRPRRVQQPTSGVGAPR